MAKYYAVEAKDILGNTRFWGDYYLTAKQACAEAKQVKRDNPLSYTVKVYKEIPNPNHQFGTQWALFRVIK